MSFGLGEYTKEKYTVFDISAKYHISQQRVTQIIQKSLFIMRRSTRYQEKQKSLKDYMC